jgi:hypothetical protein
VRIKMVLPGHHYHQLHGGPKLLSLRGRNFGHLAGRGNTYDNAYIFAELQHN